ncbi:MAG: hypothetical protein KBD73_01560 [Candidatus Magasanikbacteria bacterium]|nr:hypothetical protein [Candidatus Magasanikbacteria bacterium]
MKVSKKIFFQKLFATIFSVIFLFSQTSVSALTVNEQYPKRANYFLKWSMTEVEARELSKWDLVILDMDMQVSNRALMQKMREWNPQIIILAYITSEEIRQDAATGPSTLRRQLSAQIPEAWYVKNTSGQRLRFWPGTDLLNVSDNAPVVNGMRFNQFLAQFVHNSILSTGLWDGVFYDNAFDAVTWFTGPEVDLDRDGLADISPDSHWQAGMRTLYNETRRLAGASMVLVGNGTTRAYRDELNGNMLENFIPGSPWTPTMNTYAHGQTRRYTPVLNIINANTSNRGGQANYRQMRFGLTSALMENGYFSFDHGDTDHGQTWWYDEYGVNLGAPVDTARTTNTNEQKYTANVWQREFQNGLAVVNGSGETKKVSLGGDFERIRGVQDPVTNNGAIVDTVTLPPDDGLILLKTIATLNDVVYPNGSFVRFFHYNGTRARNGFFLFDESQSGSDQVAHIDLTNDGNRDLLVATRNFLTATRNDGQPLFKIFPYTANFSGKLFLSIGSLAESIITVTGSGGKTPVPIQNYDYSGVALGSSWRPSTAIIQNGASVATVRGSSGQKFIVVAPGAGQLPLVSLYTSDRRLVRQWYAFEKTFRGGLKLTAGDLNGDGVDEIIVAPATKKAPIIKMFNQSGKEVFPSFTAFQGTNGVIGLGVQDVDSDRQLDILVFSSAAGF